MFDRISALTKEFWNWYFSHWWIMVLSLPIIVYLLFIGASQAYVTPPDMGPYPNLLFNDLYAYVNQYNLPGFSKYGYIYVNELNALHAIRNLIFVTSYTLLFGLLPIFALIIGVVMLVQGITTSDWGNFLIGVLIATLGVFLSVAIVFLFPFLFWIILLVQDMTVAYFLRLCLHQR